MVELFHHSVANLLSHSELWIMEWSFGKKNHIESEQESKDYQELAWRLYWIDCMLDQSALGLEHSAH